jgi:hypothetical protein
MMGRRLSLVIVAICVPALALGLGLGLGGSASAAATARGSATSQGSAATSQGARAVVINCLGRAQTRPGSFTLACADGNDYLTALSWTSWTPALASGYGTEVINDCVPYCAAGHFHRYPVLAVLWGNAALHGNPGTLRYTKVTLIYTGTRPKVFNGHPGTVTDSLWA